MKSNQEKGQKIMELREAGYTWFQVDQVVFPGTSKELSKKKSPSWHLAKKLDLPAFTKQVIGWGTPYQIVIPIRRFNPHAAAV